MRYTRFFLVFFGLSMSVSGCVSTHPESGPQDDQAHSTVNFLKQKPTDADSMLALLEGELVLDGGCLYIQRENASSSHAAIWPFEFSLTVQDSTVQILSGAQELVAQVGDQIRVSGGEIPQLSPEEFASNFMGDATQCTAPYWVVNENVEVVARQ